jgi:hypothetical protein
MVRQSIRQRALVFGEIFLVAFSLSSASASAQEPAAQRPNVILIVSDDKDHVGALCGGFLSGCTRRRETKRDQEDFSEHESPLSDRLSHHVSPPNDDAQDRLATARPL